VRLFQRCRWQVDGQSDILEQVEVPLLGAEDHRMDIEAWLQGLGLECYVPAFRDNEIDWEVLPKLTSEDLREIGVAAIGHRRKLLDAIAALGASAPTAAVRTAVSDASAPADAERRQLTVMFCDLVGSTALSARLDPEDLREVIGRYHACVAETVSRCDGFVAKYMGDGVLVYFGYPQAHEDDAEQAVRAGLALVNAARLQALAEPNAVVIAASTRRQIGARFELADLGPQSLKGFADLQRIWRVLAENRTLGRFEALRSGAIPLVGREEEIELLLRRWARAKRGELRGTSTTERRAN
jgi:class 3 adenylate cyclase